MNTNTKPSCLLIAFADAPYAHWAPRFDNAFGGNVDRIRVPNVDRIADGIIEHLPDEREGVAVLVNARVAAALKGFARNDLYCLPQGAPQDGSSIDIDFLVKVE